MKLALALLLAAACSSAPPPPPPAPTPAPEPTPAPAGSDTSQTGGAKCGDKPACEAPATCVDYYGIAGARGPQFHSCEIKCDPSTPCPTGKTCRTIADGPGSVCR